MNLLQFVYGFSFTYKFWDVSIAELSLDIHYTDFILLYLLLPQATMPGKFHTCYYHNHLCHESSLISTQ